MKKDKIFAIKKDVVPSFEFNEQVAYVFDDMIKRSVPLYLESIKRQAQLAFNFFQTNTRIYDLGCSHGNLGMIICELFKDKSFHMVGVDSSLPMLVKYKKRLLGTTHNNPTKVSLICGLAEDTIISNASVVIVNLTLQFIAPDKRNSFIQNIYNGLVSGGILILTEKLTHKDPIISEVQQKYYEQFKRENGYSDLEINQKREALEDVLFPETLEKHDRRIKGAGFKTVDVWLKWFNFASMIAIKQI